MILSRLQKLLEPEEGHRIPAFLLAAMLASLFQGLAYVLAIPFLAALLKGAWLQAGLWLAVFMACVLASWITSHKAALHGFELALALLHHIREKVGDHLVHLPLGWFTPVRASRLAGALSQGVMDLLALPAHQLLPLMQALVMPPVLVIGIAFFDVTLALTAAILFPLTALVYWWAGRLGQLADRRAQQAAEEAGQRVAEFAQAQIVLRAFGVLERGHERLETALQEQARAGRRQLWMIMPPLLANSWLMQLGYLVLLSVALSRMLALEAEPARLVTLIAVMVLMNRILEPLGDVAASAAGIRMAARELARMETILAEPPLPLPVSPAALPARHDIRFSQVRFGHDPEKPLLHDFSLTLEPDRTTALVGASGAGKSTLLHLIARFFDVQAGALTIGGVDVRHLNPQDLSRLIAPVFQNAYLFSGSIRENVLMARPDAGEEELERVATLSRLDEMLERLPKGWHSAVGEGGQRLSGGERQRICMARALLKNAPILMLDEPASALDAANRAAIARMLADLHGTKTILIVAHQFEWIAGADRILVLQDGTILEDGSPADLIARNGHYATLHRLHAQPEGWRMSG